VYRTLPRAQKNRGLFNKLTALGHEWLWNGITEEEVVLRLREALTKMTASLAKPEPKGEVAASEAAYPPLDLPQRTTLLSKWWVSHQGALYQPLQISNKEGLLQRALQPLRTGWLRAYPKRE
ncbi:MAG TPA: hypothetical protein VD794_02670, partial [Flavisolibacter sp.]|nr:hypothetical protein [Flavisolibacter sp.]